MKILENIELAQYTTFKVGGRARYFCVVKDEVELKEAIAFARDKFARDKNEKVFVIGGGSNILVSDEGFSGLVIKMETNGVRFAGDFVTAAAGESWDGLVEKTVEKGLWGLENLSAIPGTVGAAPVGNIGAYGTEVKDTIESVRAVNRETGAAKTFTNTECCFSYRHSFFKTEEGKKWIVTSVAFRLSSTPRPDRKSVV